MSHGLLAATWQGRSWYAPACIVGSVLVHLGMAATLHRRHRAESAPPPPTTVELTMATPVPPPAPTPIAPDEPPARTEPVSVVRSSARAKPAPAQSTQRPIQEVREVEEVEPPMTTGKTLTTEGADASSWASATGKGEPIDRMLTIDRSGIPYGRASGIAERAASPSVPTPAGPRFVAMRDLARTPRAPSLDDALERNFPPRARQQGLSGSAVLTAQVLPDGRIGIMKRVSESSSGFADACERTLRGSRWSPPYDRSGHAVATEITYTCRFDVRD